MEDVEIRRMAPDELEAVVGVWVRSRWDAQPWLEERMGYADFENLEHFRDVIAVECRVWVAVIARRGDAVEGGAVDGDLVVGLLAMSDEGVDQLFVEPAHQGRGIGTALLRHAQALSPEGLTLFTHQRNERARAFYEARGFRAIRFGISPAPESEPDVTYEWRPSGSRRPTR